MIKVNRNYTDLATGERLTEKEDFIESLTHDSYVIQIPALTGKRRNELEKLLGHIRPEPEGEQPYTQCKRTWLSRSVLRDNP